MSLWKRQTLLCFCFFLSDTKYIVPTAVLQFSDCYWGFDTPSSYSDASCPELEDTPHMKGSITQDCSPLQVPAALRSLGHMAFSATLLTTHLWVPMTPLQV